MTARGLRLLGSDVALVAGLPCGRVRVVYLDRDGQPTCHRTNVWPHELIGNGWHLAAIKRAIAALTGSTITTGTPAPRPLLYAHHVADHQRED